MKSGTRPQTLESTFRLKPVKSFELLSPPNWIWMNPTGALATLRHESKEIPHSIFGDRVGGQHPWGWGWSGCTDTIVNHTWGHKWVRPWLGTTAGEQGSGLSSIAAGKRAGSSAWPGQRTGCCPKENGGKRGGWLLGRKKYVWNISLIHVRTKPEEKNKTWKWAPGSHTPGMHLNKIMCYVICKKNTPPF